MRHRPSLRLRLTLSYGALFFVIGFLLLVLSYVLLRQVAIKNPGELANHTAQELHLSQAYLHQHMTSPTGGRQSVGVFLRQIQDFIDGIRERRPFFIEGREARKAVALVRAAYDSAACGKPVKPAD